ncbi:MAG: helix-turn-helix domain-containing protein [Sphingobacteriia bacterium]|nr:helix-turn-helix domain-containing protein [Sphingobacteriia bacterium]
MLERIKQIMEQQRLNASQFAEKIGIQRSTLSHILSGRNKPSLDVVQRILAEFPDVDAEWLLNGVGSVVYRSKQLISVPPDQGPKKTTFPDLFSGLDTETTQIAHSTTDKSGMNTNKNAENKTVTNDISRLENVMHKMQDNISADSIEQIVLFYSNGTCKVYRTKN